MYNFEFLEEPKWMGWKRIVLSTWLHKALDWLLMAELDKVYRLWFNFKMHSFYSFLHFWLYIYIYIHLGESKVLQNFVNLFTLFFKLQQKQPSIQRRGHHIASSDATFLSVLWSQTEINSYSSKQRTPSLKLTSPLGCWSIMRIGSESGIGTNNNLREQGPDYMLGVTSVLFPQVPGVYSRN